MLRSNYKIAPSAVSSPARRPDAEIMQMLLDYRQTRKPELRDAVVMQFTNLVESIARRFSGSAEPVEDLAQEGYIGLISAIELFDPAKKVKFSTYATHFVIGQIKHCLRDRGKIIKEPAWLQELNQRMTRVIDALTQDLGHPPTAEAIAGMMDMTEEAVAEILMTREVFKVSSLDGGGEKDDDSGAVDVERRSGLDVSVSFQLPVEERIVLEAAMDKLKDLEQTVLSEFYFKDLNQTEIAKNLGISCNYVSHILRSSTKKLKKILVTDELKEAQRKVAQMQKRLEQQQTVIERDVVVDAQTRCYNRRYFEARLDEEISRASRISADLSLLTIELHGLERFTRANGTLKGDEAVTGMAETLRKTVRKADIVTRCDTAQFTLILPHTGRNCLVVAERVREALDNFLTEKGWNQGLTRLELSFGTAQYPGEAMQSALLTELALYRAREERQQDERDALPMAA